MKKIVFLIMMTISMAQAGTLTVSTGGNGKFQVAQGTGGNLGTVIFSSGVVSGSSFTPFSLSTNTINFSTNGDIVTTPAINTTGCKLLVAALSFYGGGSVPVLTDSKSNTWVQLGVSSPTSANLSITLYYSVNPIVGTGHTFTENASTTFPTLAIEGFTGGVNAAPFDVQNGSTSLNASSSHTVQPGNVVPSQDNELIVTDFNSDQNSAFSIDSGFTITDQTPSTGGFYYGLGVAYIVKGSGTSGVAVNPTWTNISSSGNLNTRIATFKVQ